jgi:hypothetical protein
MVADDPAKSHTANGEKSERNEPFVSRWYVVLADETGVW